MRNTALGKGNSRKLTKNGIKARITRHRRKFTQNSGALFLFRIIKNITTSKQIYITVTL